MRIALDAQLTLGTATGIGEYVAGLFAALRERGCDVVALKESRLDPWRFDRRLCWDQVLLPQRARRCGADLLHCASGTAPLIVSLPYVVTVHDVAWLRVQAHTRFYARAYFGPFAIARYRRARAIAVDSTFSRNELLDVVPQLDPDSIHVAYPGVERDFCALARRAGDARTILVVGTVERRKNLEVVIRALVSLRDARIVSVGPSTPYREECMALAQRLGVADRLEFRGYVTRAELLDLHATCAVVAVPSRYEGFGYALAQALCAGVPAVAAACASLPEIAAGDAVLVPPDDEAAWSDALARALHGERDDHAARVRDASSARFAWSATARTMMRMYESVDG